MASEDSRFQQGAKQVWRTIRRGGRMVAVPFRSTYANVKSIPQKSRSLTSGAKSLALDAISNVDPGEVGGKAAGFLARTVEGILKTHLDYQVEKTENMLAQYVHGREIQWKRNISRSVGEHQQLFLKGTPPKNWSAGDPVRDMFVSTKTGKKIMKLRRTTDYERRFMKQLQSTRNALLSSGIDPDHPDAARLQGNMLDALMMKDLMQTVGNLQGERARDRHLISGVKVHMRQGKKPSGDSYRD